MQINLKTFLIFLFIVITLHTISAIELDVSLIAYNSETHEARIRVENTASIDYHDIVLIIDGMEQKFPDSLLKAGQAVIIPRIIPPGTHTVMVKTKEGVIVEKELLFPKTEEQIKEELKERKLAEEKAPEVIVPTTEKVSYKKTIISLIILIAIIAALIFVIKFLKKSKNV